MIDVERYERWLSRSALSAQHNALLRFGYSTVALLLSSNYVFGFQSPTGGLPECAELESTSNFANSIRAQRSAMADGCGGYTLSLQNEK